MNQNRKRRILAAVCALALIMGLLTACGNGEEQSGGDALTPVTVVLDYAPNTNHTGFYAAKDLGYYEEAGLDISIVEPTDSAVTTLVATGKVQFGVSYQEDVTYAKTTADPLPVTAIAAILQHNTSGFASYEPKGIKVPKDFEGKVYAGWGAPSEEATIEAVMKADGADFSKVTVTSGSGFESLSALEGDIDIAWIFWAWDGVMAEQEGVPLSYIDLTNYDKRLDYYTPLIIAGDDLIADDPELVKTFLGATAKGFEYCVEDPEAAAKILGDNVPEYDLDFLIASQQWLADYFISDAPRWGEMKDEVWDGYSGFMVEYGLLDEALSAETFYTNEFLP
ncbi:MAG: ABC transporter substrate-binding protein [Clostridiales Family XIII bacterium]|jgi:ABC-type nitrate/sulfonate/bicarbonate transport system substrate-binding protein|nr:ABC transporter substrate-binding protein [Clostridiales Family XIII bacterium]